MEGGRFREGTIHSLIHSLTRCFSDNEIVPGTVLGFGVADIMSHGSCSQRTQCAEANGLINNTNSNSHNSSYFMECTMYFVLL